MTILILKRSVSMPKDVWRLPATRRTLDGLGLEPVVDAALDSSILENGEATLIESDLAADGTLIESRRLRILKHSDSSGVFDMNIADEKVKLKLSQEACRRELYTPRRSSQVLTALQFWEPIRVILNGKADWPSGRCYYLQDYHVILCGAPRPNALLPMRTFDLQADLI